MQKVRSMTEGKPMRLIVSFAFPLMLGNLCQQLYTMTDTLIVGRGVGMNALAALGAVDWYNYLIISVIQALTQGFAILLAQDFGAGDAAHLKKTHAHSIRLALIFTGGFLLYAQLTLPLILSLLNVPVTIRPIALDYLRILFAGIPIQVLFNYCAASIRSLGNSRTPLFAMLTASLVNIALDLLFVLKFQWGVKGAAGATVMAQVIAALWVMTVMRRIPNLKIAKSDYAREAGLNGKLIRMSLPMVLQNIMISIGGMISMAVVNSFGVTFLAGYSAACKWISFLEMAAVAYSYAVVTYMGQNFGAGNMERVKKGYFASLLVALVTSAVIGTVFFVFARPLTIVFLTGDPATVEAAEETAFLFIRILGAMLPLLYLLYVTRASLQGIGDTFAAMLSGIAEFVTRVFMCLVVVHVMGTLALMLCETFAWILADVVLCTAFWIHMRKLGLLGDLRFIGRRKNAA